MAERKRILVPGEAQARGGLILPGMLAQANPQTLVGKCHTCDATFYRGEEEEWQRHVGRCAREHLPEILAARRAKEKRLAAFQEENWDPEWAEHQREVGKRMIREGRLVPRPNER